MSLVSTVYAASVPLVDSIKSKIITPIVGFLAALAVISFVYGIVLFMSNLDNESKMEDGKRHMLWGLVGLAIIVSVQAILKVICDTISCGLL